MTQKERKKLEEFEQEMITLWAELYNTEKLHDSILTCCEAFGFLRCISKVLIGRAWIYEASKKVVEETTYHINKYKSTGLWDKIKDC